MMGSIVDTILTAAEKKAGEELDKYVQKKLD